jgi:hypothetical protein
MSTEPTGLEGGPLLPAVGGRFKPRFAKGRFLEGARLQPLRDAIVRYMKNADVWDF